MQPAPLQKAPKAVSIQEADGGSQLFAQMCDRLNLKRNYAKSYDDLVTRLTSKLSAMSLLYWIDHQNGRILDQIKHALSF